MSFLLLAVAVALKQAVTPEFKLYQKEVIANAQVMSRELQAKGYKVVTGKFY
jgi:glycine hydroxymethyltransferase